MGWLASELLWGEGQDLWECLFLRSPRNGTLIMFSGVRKRLKNKQKHEADSTQREAGQ